MLRYAPPAFVAKTADELLFGRAGYALIQSWVKAHRSNEFNPSERRDYGFGLGHPNNTAAGETDVLFRWLNLNGVGKKN